MRDFWTTPPRILRSSTRKTLTQPAAANVTVAANMAEDDTDALVAKISEGVFAKLNSCLDTKLDQIPKSVNSVCEKVKAVEQRVVNAEDRISDLEDTVSQLQTHIDQSEARLKDAINRLEDQENRSRRNNIKIINLPECTEGDNPRDFFETWLPKVLDLAVKNDRIKIDRVHRTPAQRRMDSTRSRTIYIRLHNFADKQKIMQKARNMGEITVSGSRIHLFEDFSPAVEKRRREFTEVKKSLQALGVEYRMLFPATLRVAYANKIQLLKSVDEAQRYVEEIQKEKR